MPSGVGYELIVAAALVAILVASVVVGRLRRSEPQQPTGEAPAPEGLPTGDPLGPNIRTIFERGEPSEERWRRLEASLIDAGAGSKAAKGVVSRVRGRFRLDLDPVALVADEVAAVFRDDPPFSIPARPSIVMVVGVSGSGKTTTIGKLAHRLVNQGRLVSLAASDTLRPAAVLEVAAWADRAGAELVQQEREADPGSVAHHAVETARARGSDVLIVDTPGRGAFKPLMDELARLRRVLEKAAGRVDEVLLILDAAAGADPISQARPFIDAVGVTGIALSKVDGTSSAAFPLAAREELGIPVKLVGTGESVEDLRAFDAGWFARILMNEEGPGAAAATRDSLRAAPE